MSHYLRHDMVVSTIKELSSMFEAQEKERWPWNWVFKTPMEMVLNDSIGGACREIIWHKQRSTGETMA